MIISRTPFRISFAGGGTDIKDYYSCGYGAVTSTAINKYMYITVHPSFYDNKILLKYSRTEEVNDAEEVKHPLIRESLKAAGIRSGIVITSIADVPGGTGLGSSSSFTVGLLHALFAYQGKYLSKKKLAEIACKIEIGILKEPIGKQDQYAAAFGGLNHIRFNQDESVFVQPVMIKPDVKKKLEENLIIFFTGIRRSASSVLKEQKANTSSKLEGLDKLRELAEEINKSLIEGNLDEFGNILHKGWLLKKSLCTKVSNDSIDKIYDKAMKNGAMGGKLLGAGAGGFFLFYCPKEQQNKLSDALGLKQLEFKFDGEGTKIIDYEA